MKRVFFVVTFSFLVLSQAVGQESEIRITEEFRDVHFNQFVKRLEEIFSVSFYYRENDVATLRISENFENKSLGNCIKEVLDGTDLAFSIKHKQVFVYKGTEIGSLFVSPVKEVEPIYEKSEEQISRERLLAKQYELINIGRPGSQNNGHATISGKISVFNSGYTVPGCNVYTKEDQRGTSTDGNGNFKLRLPVGSHTLIFSSVGMESTQRQVVLYADGRLNVELETKVNLLSDVMVTGNEKGNLNRVEIGMERIDMKSVKNLPKLLGEPDIMKSTLILPGVTSVGEGASGFNVRGGKTDQNLILIDQTPIYYPSHFFGNFSAINSDVVHDANLFKGSFPAKYGGRISSVYQINTKEGNLKELKGAGGISPLSAKVMLEGPVKKGKSSYLFSARSTYSDWILSQISVDELYNSNVNFYDIQSKFNFKLDEKNKLSINLYGSEDGFKLKSDTTYNYYNVLASASLKTQMDSNWKMQNSISMSAFGYEIGSDADSLRTFDIIHSLQNYSFRNLTEYSLTASAKLSFGGELQFYQVNPGDRNVRSGSELTSFTSRTERGLEYGLFAGIELKPVERLKLEGGIRLAGYLSLADGEKNIYKDGLPLTEDNLIAKEETKKNSVEKHYAYPEFRFSSNYNFSRTASLKFSYNITSQFLHLLTNTTAISPTDTWKLSDGYLEPQRGHSLSAGLVKSNHQNNLEMSVEGFYKRISNMKEYKAGADLLLNHHIETEILNGKGKSYGGELSLIKKGGRFYGRMGYTYSRTLVRTESEFAEELINDGEYFPANYDKPHNLNVLANLEPVRGIVFSMMLNYSTGRPITYPVTKYKLGDQVILHYSDYNQFRIPDYFRMDASITIDRNLKKDKVIDGSWSFSVYNLTGRRNAYSVYYRSKGNHFEAYKLSIFGAAIPTITYNFKF